MKSGKRGNLFLFLALAVLISSPFVFAGFGDWWTKFTGRATSQTTAVSITVGNTAPNVYFVNVTSHANGSDPSEGIMLPITVMFNATDADGVGTLVNSSARATINLSGDFYYNQTCPFLWGNSTDASYNCTIYLPYYAVPGSYNVNGSIADLNGARGTKWGMWVLGTLNSMTINVTNITFGSISAATTNTDATSNPTGINNTGNRDWLRINVTAINLRAWTNAASLIYANNFTVGAGPSSACDSGTALVNGTATNITSAVLNRGNNITTGLETLNFCLEGIPANATADTYNSTLGGAWSILAEPGDQI